MICLPSIVQQILDTVCNQLEDADYEENARVIIGYDMVLLDKDEFYELKKYVTDGVGANDFDEIVKTSESSSMV